MEKGQLIGSYLVDKVIRPLNNGHALYRVRYEGSSIFGYLCAVDSRIYNWQGPQNTLLTALNEIASSLNIIVEVLDDSDSDECSEVAMLLPKDISISSSLDDGCLVLGYFSESQYLDYIDGAVKACSYDDLKGVALLLDHTHSREISQGSVHPFLFRKRGSFHRLPCPLFPIVLFSQDSVWSCDLSRDRREEDRKAFAMLLSDYKGKRQEDIAGFSARLENWRPYIESIKGAEPFVSGNRGWTFAQFLDQALPQSNNVPVPKVTKRSQLLVYGVLLLIMLFLWFLFLNVSKAFK